MTAGAVVIAGGRGFLGGWLRRALAERNVPVVVVSRSAAPLPDAQVVTWSDEQHLRAVLTGCRALVNLCGENIGARRWTAARRQQLLDSRVRPAAQLAEALLASAARVPVYVGASGVGYYGPGAQPVGEDAPAGTHFLGQLAADWERAHAGVPAQRTVVLRIGVVLDAHDGALPRLLLPFRLAVGGRIGSGAQGFAWVHRDDLVAAVLHALDSADLGGAVNVAAPEPVSNAQMARALGRVLRRPVWLPLPEWPLRLALGELHVLLTQGQWLRIDKLLDSGFRFRHASISAAFADLLGG